MTNRNNNLSRYTGLLAIAGCVMSVKLFYDATFRYYNAPSDILVDPWEARTAARILIAFLLVVIGTFIKVKLGKIISLIACAGILVEYSYWFYFSYQAFKNPYIGAEALRNKIGLISASWWHVLVLLITLLLTAALIYPKLRTRAKEIWDKEC